MILASGSPRRSELIKLTGWQVDIRPVQIDETPLEGEDALALATRLAEVKARAAAASGGQHEFILAADTVVAAEGELLGKPTSEEQAIDMLTVLGANTHQVHTAIAVHDPKTGEIWVDACSTDVPMRDYSLEEVRAYVQTRSPMDKAGAYGIQDRSFQPVETAVMSGCYANVVGLPICHVVRLMRKLDCEARENVPRCCQEHTGYDCPVYTQILGEEI